jgi:catechol 2,3-dioxygenase-like lactoylglutathione lyase family enzyme
MSAIFRSSARLASDNDPDPPAPEGKMVWLHLQTARHVRDGNRSDGSAMVGREIGRANVEIEMPSMKIARVILFTGQIDAMSEFYGGVLGLKQVTNEKGWREFAAGGARIALHSGPSSPGRKGPKIVFHAKDVAALREALVARGARFGKVRQGEIFCLCDGKDPDGNPIQLSDR